MKASTLIPSVAAALSLALAAGEDRDPAGPMRIDFEQGSDAAAWVAVNDGVMGGLSRGGAMVADGTLRFSGELSLENNGGFSSVRVERSYDLDGAEAMVMRVRGDGRTYQLRLSTDARYRGSRIAYQAEFATKAGEWTELRVPFGKLSPSHHGNALEGPPLDLTEIREIGFLIADKKAGPFALEVDWMEAG